MKNHRGPWTDQPGHSSSGANVGTTIRNFSDGRIDRLPVVPDNRPGECCSVGLKASSYPEVHRAARPTKRLGFSHVPVGWDYSITPCVRRFYRPADSFSCAMFRCFDRTRKTSRRRPNTKRTDSEVTFGSAPTFSFLPAYQLSLLAVRRSRNEFLL